MERTGYVEVRKGGTWIRNPIGNASTLGPNIYIKIVTGDVIVPTGTLMEYFR